MGFSAIVPTRTVVLFVRIRRKSKVIYPNLLILAFIKKCTLVLEQRAAAFNGHSYVQLKKLKAYHRFSLEMEFKSFSDDGILLYDQQQQDGSGDFISIAIVNK